MSPDHPKVLSFQVPYFFPYCLYVKSPLVEGFPGGSDCKEPTCNAGDLGSIPGGSPGDQEDPLEKGMVTHSSILAWRIPRIEEHGGLQSMGSRNVGHD